MSKRYGEQILAALDTCSALTTGAVASHCSPMFGNKRMHSALIRGELLELQREGKVKPMDDQKPVCWVLIGDPT